jgi:ketosteroid isomerase-like protein
MKTLKHFPLLLLFFALSAIFSCTDEPTAGTSDMEQQNVSKEENEAAMIAAMEKHLNAVSNKDLATLRSTMSPSGKMHLILPGAEIMQSVDSFMQYHEEWFQDTSWTFETKILSTEVDQNLGTAVTEIVYREPERDGRPYWNRMIVTYSLQKEDGQWYVIQDHASSIEKSTD